MTDLQSNEWLRNLMDDGIDHLLNVQWLIDFMPTQHIFDEAISLSDMVEFSLVMPSLDDQQDLNLNLRPKPASQASVEALEKLVFEVRVHGSSERESFCVVCLENMLSGDRVTRMPCSHIFHGDCIVEWLKQGHICPLCRFELPQN
ncbi:PREDICTED: E3 [Prunus dulcis]|uniref:RING-type E3 ubiquitin transferase n=1 Tax=Prunus dulcis TaxID=3755 RepID=A0A5E4FSL8_PRUDU|nr:PREDICTED: E3 [Prunus dulcis]